MSGGVEYEGEIGRQHPDEGLAGSPGAGLLASLDGILRWIVRKLRFIERVRKNKH